MRSSGKKKKKEKEMQVYLNKQLKWLLNQSNKHIAMLMLVLKSGQ